MARKETGKQQKFKVGDKIIGLPSASEHYGITKESWIGTVENVNNREGEIYVKSSEKDCAGWWVSSKYFALLGEETTSKETTKGEKTMTRRELFETIFVGKHGYTGTPCPTINCNDCPARTKSGSCRASEWWADAYDGSFTLPRPSTPSKEKKPKKDGLEMLCYHYNRSDSEGLAYIQEHSLCTTAEQINELEKLLLLNELIYVHNSEKHTEMEYRIRYLALLSSLGIRVDLNGYAHIKVTGETAYEK